MDLLVPTGANPATAEDLDRLALSTDQRFDAVDQRFDAVDQRIDELARSTDQRFDALEHRMDLMHQELVAIFRGELLDALQGQSRAVVQGVFTAIIGIAVLSLSFAQLLG